jgi:hypothetical protein
MANKDHLVKLIYDFGKHSFKPDNEPEVKPGETISFELVTVPHRESEFKVTMAEKGYFEPSEADSSKPKMTLKRELKDRMTYSCELIDSKTKTVVDEASKEYGGGVRPGH